MGHTTSTYDDILNDGANQENESIIFVCEMFFQYCLIPLHIVLVHLPTGFVVELYVPERKEISFGV